MSRPPARRRPQTTRGRATHAQLLRGAERAFHAHGYQKASVAAVCREAGVANGTFYQYFDDKRAIFEAVVDRLAADLHARLRRAEARGADPLDRLVRANRAFFETVAQRARSYQAFRESEFVDLAISQAFYRPLAKRYAALIASGVAQGQLCSDAPEASAWGLLGAQAFLATRWIVWEPPAAHTLDELLETSERFLRGGLGCGTAPLEGANGDERSASRSEPDKGSTRKALLEAAESLFGARGFYATSVADITRAVGVAQGTFYLYFPSKVAIFAQLVREINAALIAATRRATAGLRHRREVERAGFGAFFGFISRHRLAYRIVREAEFVDEEAGQGYYRRIAAGYVKGLEAAMARGEVRPFPVEPLAYCLMGLGHFAGLKWFVWEEREALPPATFDALMRLVGNGLGAPGRDPDHLGPGARR